MNIVVIGLGSMGRRRIRLLRQFEAIHVVVGVDAREDRRKQAENEYGIATADSIEAALEMTEIQAAVVSTSPLSHRAIIARCLDCGLHVFSELNLVSDGYDDLIHRSEETGKVLFLSSTFLYRKEVEFIKKSVEESSGRLNYFYHAGQYLPDWHPWESYKSFFVGNKATNGCREFMAIEFPWLTDVFGDVKSLYSVAGVQSTLDLDFPDNYQIIVEHQGGNKGMIAVDVVSRKAVRNFELSGEDLYLTWDGTPTGLVKYDFQSKQDKEVKLYEEVDRQKGYSSFVIENAYQAELANFLACINEEEKPRYSFTRDKYILSIIDEIEQNK